MSDYRKLGTATQHINRKKVNFREESAKAAIIRQGQIQNKIKRSWTLELIIKKIGKTKRAACDVNGGIVQLKSKKGTWFIPNGKKNLINWIRGTTPRS